MKYHLATNFDNELIKRIAALGTIEEVYGKFSSDVVGGGRPSIILPKISREQLREHIKTCHDYGIKFNYLLNASCLSNREFIAESNREIMGLVRQIEEDGTDSLTLSSIPLAMMIKKQYPKLKICASIYLGITNVERIKHFEALGFDELTLTCNFNRNFSLLERAVSAVDKPNLRLIANNTCLHYCPNEIPGHANTMAHASQSKHESNGFCIDIFSVMCGLQKMINPAELIMSDWIRPEDVHVYDEIGRGKIVLKLTDRARPTDWLARTAKAYSEESYDGNLFDILNFIGNGKYAQIDRWKMIKGALSGKAKLRELKKLDKASFIPEVFVDNRQLDGFLTHFQKNPCNGKLCYTESKPYGDCRFCYETARRVVKINEDERKEAIAASEKTLETIFSGEMFR